MNVKELLEYFKDEKNPRVSAAAFLGIHPQTILSWENKNGKIPPQWEAYFKSKQKEVI